MDTVDRQARDQNTAATTVRPLWSEPRVCQALGLTTDALAALRATGRILWAALSDGVVVYPVSQFHHSGGVVEVRPGLLPLLRALREQNGWTVVALLKTHTLELDGQTPLDWVRRGGDSEVVNYLAMAMARTGVLEASRRERCPVDAVTVSSCRHPVPAGSWP